MLPAPGCVSLLQGLLVTISIRRRIESPGPLRDDRLGDRDHLDVELALGHAKLRRPNLVQTDRFRARRPVLVAIPLSRRERMVVVEPRGAGMALFTLRAAEEEAAMRSITGGGAAISLGFTVSPFILAFDKRKPPYSHDPGLGHCRADAAASGASSRLAPGPEGDTPKMTHRMDSRKLVRGHDMRKRRGSSGSVARLF
jgi:hypothetical protein